MTHLCHRLIAVIPLLFAASCLAATPGEEAFLNLIDRQNDGVVIPLWPNGAVKEPDTESIEVSRRTDKAVIKNVNQPSIIVVPPSRNVTATGTTLMFAPGGGYGILSLSVAADIYKWAGAVGAHCVLLKYRVPKSKDDPGRRIPLSDAQRAVRLLRSKAKSLKIETNRIIVVGASAGGHLCFNLANNHKEETYQPVDNADKLSAKPDAAVLLYPAYLTNPIPSLDTDPHLQLKAARPGRTSPIFITMTRPDKFTWGAVNAITHLRKSKVPVELHVYPEGGHGGCLDKYPLMEFIRPASRFLKDQGLFTAAMEAVSNKWLDELQTTFLKTTTVVSAAPTTTSDQPSNGLTQTKWTAGDRALATLRDPAPTVIALWPGDGKRTDDPGAAFEEELPQRPDGLVRITKISRPTMHHWKPQRPDGRAVVIFPGGAYNGLAAEHEGTQIAEWLNGQGITAFVTKYRVPRRKGLEKHAVAFQDAQRAIRLVRSRAREFGVDPKQIGVMGFSAGGHLATMTVHHAKSASYTPIDNYDKTGAEPNFAILIYPAYLTATRDGIELDPLVTTLKSRNDYPPVFMAVAADDVYAPSSLHYLLHLHQQEVPGELHVYTSGGHGKGLRKIGYPFSQWTQPCQRWLADLQLGITHLNLNQ